jgi:UDPglucose 6-dehydrogenase
MDKKIGIVGFGTVGMAVYHSFSPHFETVIYDPDKEHDDFHNLFDCDCIFMCLPNEKLVMDMGYQIADFSEREDILFIVKTTLSVGFTEELQKICGNAWCYNPEFLTERTAIQDFRCQHRIVLGHTGDDEAEMAEEYYKEVFRHVPVIRTRARTAEMAKLMTNLFFMTKISFMNEMKDVADHEGICWDNLMKIFTTDGRISNSHLEVPGHDGIRGFGGKCFPDNLERFMDYLDKNNYDSEMIKAIKKTNDKYR